MAPPLNKKRKKSAKTKQIYYIPPAIVERRKKSAKTKKNQYIPPAIVQGNVNVVLKPTKGTKATRTVEMSNRMPDASFIQNPHLIVKLGTSQSALVLKPDNTIEDTTYVFTIALREIQNAPLNKLYGMFKTLMTSIVPLPSLGDAIDDVLADQGFHVEEIMAPSELENNFIDSLGEEPLNPAQVYVIWSVLTLILFKNLGPANYSQFMTSWMKALRSQVGLPEDLESGLPVDYHTARNIRVVFGASDHLKGVVLDCIITNSGGCSAFARACKYVGGILAWHDLHIFKFMYRTLCLTNSIVLLDIRVLEEARNLHQAFLVIDKQEYPCYARFTASDSDMYHLEMSKFPTLIAVALELMKTTMRSLNNFIWPTNAHPILVKDLVRMHKEQFANPVALELMKTTMRSLNNFIWPTNANPILVKDLVRMHKEQFANPFARAPSGNSQFPEHIMC